MKFNENVMKLNEKSVKISKLTNESIDEIVLYLRKRFPQSTHITKKGVMNSAILRYKDFLINELKKTETSNQE